MAYRSSTYAILTTLLIGFCVSASVQRPGSIDQQLALDNHTDISPIHRANERCSVRLSAKFPHSVRIDLRTIEASNEGREHADISSRSLSPWNNSVHNEVNRFPEEIPQADCLHSMCLDSDGKEDSHGNSVPIRHQILVLRWEQKGCHQVYRLEKQWVTFGCTCVRRRSYS